jgi:hypothetical protein
MSQPLVIIENVGFVGDRIRFRMQEYDRPFWTTN